MPVITISKSDLENLVGRELDQTELYRLFTKLKCEIESIERDTIVFEANSDRPDLFSVEGVARAMRPWLGIPWREHKIVESSVHGYAKHIEYRPFVALAVVNDLKLSDEAVSQIMQLQEKIAQTHGRNRRKVSIGVYDLDHIKPPIFYDLVDPREVTMRPLNENNEMTLMDVLEKTEKGVLYGHIIKDRDKFPVLRDSENNILSLVPIVNSDDCKITPYTKRVLIDATGTSLVDVVNAVTIMATSIAERSGTGTIESINIQYENGLVVKAPRSESPEIVVPVEDVNRLLGVELDAGEIQRLVKYFYFEVLRTHDSFVVVKPPVFRIDVNTWVDVAEDIAIAIGYEVLGGTADSLPPARAGGSIHPLEYLSRRIRDLMIGLGFQEVASYMMSNRETQLSMLGAQGEIFVVENPRSERFEGLRVWLTPQLVEVIAENSEKHHRIMIFEIGDVAIPDQTRETQARIERRLGIAIYHERATLTDGLAYINALLRELKITPVFEKGTLPGFLPERTALIKACNNQELGFVGEIDPRALYRRGLKNPVVISELYLSKIHEDCLLNQ